MTPHEFIQKWQRASLSERSAYQQHFLDLCELLGQPKPAAADPDGAWYTFERGVHKTDGRQGWADVWMRNHFGWEYKGKHKDLVAAYKQLLQYREDLENPPLLVVCDLDRFEVHTNFTGTVKQVHAFDLAGLAEPENLDTLRKVFTEPEALRPGQTTEGVTRQAAELIGQIADGMRVRDIAAHDAAHFLMKLMFSMFAEDIGLLRNQVFSKTLTASKDKPGVLAQRLAALFEAMSTGGYFGADEVLHFDGGLFADAAVIELRPDEIRKLVDVNNLDWSDVEPSVFGTLFERTLDPNKRSQIGAHYTSRADIETLLEPVVMQPLRREWDEVKAKCEKLTREAAKAKTTQTKRKKVRQRDNVLRGFVERLAHVTVLDPACGSGNFLYVALGMLLDLNKEVISYAARLDVGLYPQVRPTQLLGIEINEYAQQLASVVIWIGYLQWMHDNGFTPQLDPVLEPFESIRLMDAILDLSDPEHPREPEWPAADFIVGNPPFLGGKLMRTHLGDEYMESLFAMWRERVRPEADLCCYWFEKARRQIERGKTGRAGLLATQGIRGGANRDTLKRIKKTGDIFFAESDREWILDGANVHVSMVGFDAGGEPGRVLDGHVVSVINPNLSGTTADITQAKRLGENRDIGYMGDTKVGPFEAVDELAISWLSLPNPTGRPNSDVVRPWVNSLDITRRFRSVWIVDFPPGTAEADAAKYEAPFEHIKTHVRPYRAKARSGDRTGVVWWVHQRPRPDMRTAIERLPQYLSTPTVSKHRVFASLEPFVLPDHQLIVFARSDDYFFGVLHSRLHEVWGLKLGTRLETRPRYTPTTCFETFPFPEPTDVQRETIAAAAKELDGLRTNWLNPPEWTRTEVLEFPGSVDGPWGRYVDAETVRGEGGQSPFSGAKMGTDPGTGTGTSLRSEPVPLPGGGIGTVRYPRMVAKDDECAKQLKRRTLTNLYNERPTWLELAHRKLDEAVFAAYGWDPAMSDEELLAALLELNLARAAE